MSRALSKPTLCSTLAIATALTIAPRPAAAQSFIGTVNSEIGAHVHTLGNGNTTINVQNTQAVINWTATGASNNGVITFQQAGTTATFQGNNQFAVLNRVSPGTIGSAILIDGRIQTSVNGNSGGGTVFFSSPNGVIVGQHAIIDVGSIGITALPVVSDDNGNWIRGFGTTSQSMTFGPALNPNAFVRIDPGAVVSANGVGSYVALVAPRIDLQGTIRTDGVAALVAAELATITIRDNGLWDIIVPTGTTHANGITMSGSITRNKVSLGGNHTAYLVSVAKNDAVTMLFDGGSQLGFDVAGSAAVEGNSVVLSAGADVLNGSIAGFPSGNGTSSITLDGLTTSSRLTAIAHGTVNVTSNSAASTFGGDVALWASGHINIAATGHDLTFAKSLTASTERAGTAGDISVRAAAGQRLQFAGLTGLSAIGTGTTGTGTGGHIGITADGGQIVLSGLSASASGVGGSTGGSGSGGQVSMDVAAGGTISSSGTISADARGIGGSGGGSGTGGTAWIRNAGGILQLNAGTNLSADGVGGAGATGGTGRGGTAQLLFNAGTSAVRGQTISANGVGGSGGATGGAGIGGTAEILTASGNHHVSSPIGVSARGVGGAGGAGGSGTGGTARVAGSGGNALLAGATIDAGAAGGAGASGAGGWALSGKAELGSSGAAINFNGGVDIRANAVGGNGAGGGGAAAARALKAGEFNAGMIATGGSITVAGDSTLDAGAVGGVGSGGRNGGNATGGLAGVVASGSGASNGTIQLGRVVVSASATGGAGGSGATGISGGAGGDATGGSALLLTRNTETGFNQLTATGASLSSDGVGGAGGAGGNGASGSKGGNGTGGFVQILSGAGNGVLTLGAVDYQTSGTGGAGGPGGANAAGLGGSGGTGGNGRGGTASVGIASGDPSFSTRGTATIASLVGRANSTGGAGGQGGTGASGNGGGGRGGDAAASSQSIVARGGSLSIGTANISAYSQSGGGSPGGVANTSNIALSFTGRSVDPGSRSSVSIGSLDASTVATGATTRVDGGAQLYVEDSDVRFGQYATTVSAAGGMAPESAADSIRILSGSVTVDEAMSVMTDNRESVLLDQGSLTAGSILIDAANFVTDTPPYSPAAAKGLISAGSIDILSGQDIVMDARLASGGSLYLYALGLVGLGDLVAASDISTNAGSTITLGAINAGSSLALFAGGDVNAGTLTGHDIVVQSSDGDITLGDINAGGFVEITAWGGGLSIGDIQSVLDVSLYAGTGIAVGDILVGGTFESEGGVFAFSDGIIGQSIDLESGGAIFGGSLIAADSITVEAGGSVSLGDLSAGLVQSATYEGADYVIGAVSGGDLTIGSASAASHIGLGALGNLNVGAIDSGGIFLALVGGDMTIASILAVGPAYLADASMVALGGDLDEDFDPTPILASAPVRSGGAIRIDGTITAESLTAASGHDFSAAAITTAGATSVDSGGGVALSGNASAGGAMTITANGALNTLNLLAGSDLSLSSGDALNVGDLKAGGSIAGQAGTDASIGALTAGHDVQLLAARNLDTGAILAAGATVLKASDGAITIDGSTSAGSLSAHAGTDFESGDITTHGPLSVQAANDISTGAIDAADALLFHAGDLVEQSIGSILTGDVTATGSIVFTANGTVNSGDLTAGNSVTLSAPGAITTGDIVAGQMFGLALAEAGGGANVLINSGTAVATDDIRATGAIAVSATGGITTDALNAGESVRLSAGTGIAVDGATSVGGHVDLASNSGPISAQAIQSGGSVSAATSGAVGLGAINASGDVALSAGSDMTINGPVHAERVDARAGQDLTTSAIQASMITAQAGGTATISGQWNAGATVLTSNDIAIGANGGISGNQVLLQSSNGTQTLIGDGLVPAGQTAAGYLLDGSEFARIDADQLVIVGNDQASARIDMLIGDVTLRGSDGEAWRSYVFATGPLIDSTPGGGNQLALAVPEGWSPGGAMRVVGEVVGPADETVFASGTVEVDANTATIALESQGGLTGDLTFFTPHLHVASAAILDQLAVSTTYAARDHDLQTPTTTARPEGVVRAANIYVDLFNPGEGDPHYTVLVQNSGTSTTRAGFLAGHAEVFAPEGTPPGAIDLIVNGQIDTGETILTGADVRDALMEDDDPARFTAGSSINGCPVGGGACAAIVNPPPPPPKPNFDPNPLQGQIVLISSPAPDKLAFGNEEAIEDNQEEGGIDSASSPIIPPQPLFDSRPLDAGDETDEPISGGGNPALIGAGTVTLDQLDDEDDDQKKKRKPGDARPPADQAVAK